MPKQSRVEKFLDFQFDESDTIEGMAIPRNVAGMKQEIQREVQHYQAAAEVEQAFALLKCGHWCGTRVMVEKDADATVNELKTGLGVSNGEDLFMRTIYSDPVKLDQMAPNGSNIQCSVTKSWNRYSEEMLEKEVTQIFRDRGAIQSSMAMKVKDNKGKKRKRGKGETGAKKKATRTYLKTLKLPGEFIERIMVWKPANTLYSEVEDVGKIFAEVLSVCLEFH